VSRCDLDIVLPADEPVIIWRRFSRAPPALVFRAWTDADHPRHWWGPSWMTLTVCEIDLRVGGSYRFVHRAPDGQEHGVHGVHREIDPPRRLVSSFVYEGTPQHEAVDAIDLEEADGGTLLRGRSLHDSIEARDRHVAAGMGEGMTDAHRRLDEWLASRVTEDGG